MSQFTNLNNPPIKIIYQSSDQPINFVSQCSGLLVDQLKLPHHNKSGYVMTENVSPHPTLSPQGRGEIKD